MRSWWGSTQAFAAVVKTVQVSKGSPVTGSTQRSQRPAKAKTGDAGQVKNHGGPAGRRAPVPCRSHSKKPSTGIKQRRSRKAERNIGFSRTVSDRALKALRPIFGSLDQEGTSPHRAVLATSAPSSERMSGTREPGKKFSDGSHDSSSLAPNVSATTAAGCFKLNLPHMTRLYAFHSQRFKPFLRARQTRQQSRSSANPLLPPLGRDLCHKEKIPWWLES
jgi:hypothetical protein